MLTAFVMVLIYCTSYLDAVAHYVLVQHVRCAEHGTWEHVEHEEHVEPLRHEFNANQAERAKTDEGTPGEQRAKTGSVPGSHEHEHCTHWAGQRQVVDHGISQLSLHARLIAVSSDLVDLPPGALLLSAAIYGFAPKTSPPV